MNKRILLTVTVLLAMGVSSSADEAAPIAKLLDVQRIWDQAPHNAFTGLVRFQDRWYCAFREAKSHNDTPGRLRVLVSEDGREWTSAALITPDNRNIDLRDSHLSVTPQGELMLNGVAGTRQADGIWSWQSLAWFSKDGRNWGNPLEIGDENFWLWEVVWHQGKAYAAGYSCRRNEDKVRFYRSDDGRKFQVVADNILPSWAPPDYVSGETGFLFSENDTCYALVRRDKQPNEALFGRAKAPYTKWIWKRLDKRRHCPKMLQLSDGRIWIASRLFDGVQHMTAISWLDVEKGELHEVLKLPSGGDEGYPGMVYHEGLLWISYYSSHEGKASIYLAKVKVDCGEEP